MICGELPAWRDVRDERDRKAFFDEYISTLRKQDKDAEHARSKTVIDKLLALFQSTMEISERTRWRDLDTILEKMPAYVEDEEVRGAKAMDRLTAFEEHIKALEKVEGDRRLAERETRIRNERKKRDAFKVGCSCGSLHMTIFQS